MPSDSHSERRIVITGLGVVSPIGTGREAFWQGLRAGASAVDRITAFDAGPIGGVGAEIHDFVAKKYVKKRKSLKVMARDIQLAVASAHLAIEDAGLQDGVGDPTRMGVGYGAGVICSELNELGVPVTLSQSNGEFDFQKWGAEGMNQLFPLWLLKYLPNMLACHISIFHDAQGPNNTITGGDAASHLAIGEAARVIARGAADVMIAGGADSKIHPLQLVRLRMLDALTQRTDEPQKACRPFDRQRDGMVPGEAASTVILEELSHAQQRGATIYAELCGFGAASDAGDPWHVNLDGKATRVALERALADAEATPDQVGLIVANGLSMPKSDMAEARAINRVFDGADPQPMVTAPKSLYGNVGAGNGAVDVAATSLAILNDTVFPTANYDEPDPDCPVNVVEGEAVPLPPCLVATQSFTWAGQSACLLLKKFEA